MSNLGQSIVQQVPLCYSMFPYRDGKMGKRGESTCMDGFFFIVMCFYITLENRSALKIFHVRLWSVANETEVQINPSRLDQLIYFFERPI